MYVYCDLDLWPMTYKINRVHPLTMANFYAKFDREAHNGLVSILFTSFFPYMSIVTLIFDLWSPKSIGFILSSYWTCLPSLMNKHTMVKFLSYSQGKAWRTHAHTDRRTEPQQRYNIPFATRCTGIKMFQHREFILHTHRELIKAHIYIFRNPT